MESNFIDRVVGYFNPEAGLKRMQQRLATENVRSYNAATQGRRRGNLFNSKTSAGTEAARNADILAGVSQQLVRNNPLAQRIKMIMASNIIGDGIRLDITMGNRRAGLAFNNYVESWANSTDCDFDGNTNLFGLQWLAMATVVESGGCLVRFHINAALAFPLQLQLIEQTNLDNSMNRNAVDGKTIINGVQFSALGQVEGYWIRIDPTGTGTTGLETSNFYRKGDEMIHLYRKERPGQHLGVSWMAQIAGHLDRYDTLQDAKIMQQQIAACLAIIVEDPNTNIGKAEEPLIDALEPGLIQNVAAGTKVTTVTPPRADDSSTFITELKNDIAVGAGLNYQQLTGDYSKFNFASGRMGKIEFNLVLDQAQKFMLLPGLNAIFDKLKQIYELQNGRVANMTYEWVFPPRAAVDPAAELDVVKDKIRSALMTPQTGAKMFGTTLEKVVTGWENAYELFGDLPFDIRPDQFSSAGNQLNVDDAASSNAESSTANNNNNDDNA